MTTDSKSVSTTPATASALLRRMTDSPALPDLVARLGAEQLHELVREIGIEDSTALVVHASPAQLAHLVDETIWAGTGPGKEDVLSVPELLRWFELWLDISEQFAADKLFDLGEEFCALAFSKLVIVGPVEQPEETPAQIGHCLVSPHHADEWDLSRALLVALWESYPDFTEAFLNRLESSHSILRLTGQESVADTLELDAGFERQTRREAKGFVSSATSSAFLTDIARSSLDDLVDALEYDPHSQTYFERRKRLQARQAGEVVSDNKPPESAYDSELDDLERELENYQSANLGGVALLSGPEEPDTRVTPLRDTLARHVTDVASFTRYSDEMAYLGNLAKTEVTAFGQPLTAAEAAELVIATCNLGGSYLLWLAGAERHESQSEHYLEHLETPAGLIRLFRIGWKLLSNLPDQTAARVTQTLTAPGTREHWQTRAWLAEEIDRILREPDLGDVVKSGDLSAARETLGILSIVFQGAAVEQLKALIDQAPRITGWLLTGDPDRKKAYHHITLMRDLVRVDHCLQRLHDYLH